MPDSENDLGEWWIQQRGRIDQASRALFDLMLLLVAWTIWKERNRRVFGRAPSSMLDVIGAVIKEGKD
jgi:hypothetical protein